MRKDITFKEAIEKGLDIASLLGLEAREGKNKYQLKKRPSNEEEIDDGFYMEEVAEDLDVPTWMTEDYKVYKKYVLDRGGVPSVEDYIIAINHYRSEAIETR